LAAVLLAALTGCSNRAAQRNTRVAGTQEQMTQVSVSETEYAITMQPSSAPAGTVIFNVKNDGKYVHSFKIEGNGVNQTTPVLQPGKSTTLRVENLKAGTYHVYCPIDNHEARGMTGTFTVK
jgi:uncharacterized cupredoxin-like copper-binding protein